jgi:hypothetical protein
MLLTALFRLLLVEVPNRVNVSERSGVGANEDPIDGWI